MRRNIILSVVLVCACALFGACGVRETTVTNATANSNTTTANTNAAPGAQEGAGPHNAGIGGTGEDNRNATVAGNSNIEPTGVNKNAGRSPANSNH
ncbi:MAG: hypothetical protein QOF61_205 [Acidobacteriota bacterium]|nr:hypothetical protein [Acidobacteriota bacterium]